MGSRSLRLWIGLSLACLFGAPLLVVGGLFLDHTLGYDGICGPYAPDIDAFPCSRAEHADYFFAGFAGIALIMIAFSVFAGAIVVLAVVWSAVLVVRAIRARKTAPGAPSVRE